MHQGMRYLMKMAGSTAGGLVIGNTDFPDMLGTTVLAGYNDAVEAAKAKFQPNQNGKQAPHPDQNIMHSGVVFNPHI